MRTRVSALRLPAKPIEVIVKGGHNVNVSHIRDLGHVIDRENAAIGVYLTLDPPTAPMINKCECNYAKVTKTTAYPLITNM